MSASSARSGRLTARARSALGRVTGRSARLVKRHGWLDIGAGYAADISVKPEPYLPVYEQLLGRLRTRRFSLLELGIWKADSLLMWRSAFPRATIVGVDLTLPEVEDLGPRVHMVAGDQGDPELFERIRPLYAPAGFEVIVDDASHIGQVTARSLQALYHRHLRPGGLYIIEDWGTGYSPTWVDGEQPHSVVGVDELADGVAVPRAEGGEGEAIQLAGHDFGMVGLVKRLIDHTASGTLSVHQPRWLGKPLPIEWMRVHDGLVILKKSPAASV
jgi:hypothetical protein